MEKKYSNVL